jgi:AraC-like DNA-binding protein
MSHRLSRYAAFSTDKTDEFVRFISRLMDRRIKILQRQDFGFSIHTAKLELLTVNAVQLGGGFSTRSVDTGYVLTRLESGGMMERSFDNNPSHTIGPGDGSLILPGSEVATILQPSEGRDMQALMIGLPAPVLEGEAGLLIGEPVRHPLELTGPVDLRSSTHLGQLIDVVLRLLEDDDFFEMYPLVGMGLQRRLVGALIENTPNNYQQLLKRHYGGPARQHVRLLEEYAEAHLRDALTVGDMAQAAGVSARTLRDSARRMRKKTPEMILRTMRLHAAHKRFENPVPEDTVASVAREYGFSNTSRFARQYQHEFRGESPFETLQRGRRRLIIPVTPPRKPEV